MRDTSSSEADKSDSLIKNEFVAATANNGDKTEIDQSDVDHLTDQMISSSLATVSNGDDQDIEVSEGAHSSNTMIDPSVTMVNNGDNHEIDHSEEANLAGQTTGPSLTIPSSEPTTQDSPSTTNSLLNRDVPTTAFRSSPPYLPTFISIYRFVRDNPDDGWLRPIPSMQDLTALEGTWHRVSLLPNGLVDNLPSPNCQCSLCRERDRAVLEKLFQRIAKIWTYMWYERKILGALIHKAQLAGERLEVEVLLDELETFDILLVPDSVNTEVDLGSTGAGGNEGRESSGDNGEVDGDVATDKEA